MYLAPGKDTPSSTIILKAISLMICIMNLPPRGSQEPIKAVFERNERHLGKKNWHPMATCTLSIRGSLPGSVVIYQTCKDYYVTDSTNK
eukprot:1627412-Amphidinium_carterae.1